MNSLGYFVHLIIYELIILSPLILVAPGLMGEPRTKTLDFILGAVGLVYLLVASWLAHDAARRRVLEGDDFFEALFSSLNYGKFILSLLPVIGGWFRPKTHKSPPNGPSE